MQAGRKQYVACPITGKARQEPDTEQREERIADSAGMGEVCKRAGEQIETTPHCDIRVGNPNIGHKVQASEECCYRHDATETMATLRGRGALNQSTEQRFFNQPDDETRADARA